MKKYRSHRQCDARGCITQYGNCSQIDSRSANPSQIRSKFRSVALPKQAGVRRTKSGIMLGLGETEEEVKQTMRDLRDANVDIVTIGQYLQPSKNTSCKRIYHA